MTAVTFNHRLSRRHFLAASGMAAAGCALARAEIGSNPPGSADKDPAPREADFYQKLDRQAVRCRLCPRGCVIGPGRRGYCRVRENRDGTLFALSYGRPVALTPDPVEKKPFFHVLPGTRAYSLATVGCNITCKFCQNYDISQAAPGELPTPYRSPAALAQAARAAQCATLAFTYSEPVVFHEYMADCARAGRALGIRSLMISNGFITPDAMKALLPLLAAVKIDLKAFTDSFYRDACDGRLQPVLDTLKLLAGSGVWFEIVTLLIPTLNDAPDDIRRLCAWVAKELGDRVPLHFSRFHPAFRMRNLPPTPYDTLRLARVIGLEEGLKFVYIGNAPGLGGEDTACPACGEMVIRRHGYQIRENRIRFGACPACAKPVPGLWA